MPINRDQITYLFLRYHESQSIARQLIERSPEIPLYQFALESSSPEEYISVLCGIIHAHLHWRISGYSHTRAAIASAAAAAARMTAYLAHRGAVIAADAAQRSAVVAADAAQRGAVLATDAVQRGGMSLATSLIGYFRPQYFVQEAPRPSSPISECDPTVLPSPPEDVWPIRPHPLSPTALAPVAFTPVASAPVPFTSASFTRKEIDDDWVNLDPLPPSPSGTHAAEGTGMQGAGEANSMSAPDPRILLFNDIIRHVFINDPIVFHTQIMSVAFMKIIKAFIIQSREHRSVTYARLFFSPEVINFIERDYELQPDPTLDLRRRSGYFGGVVSVAGAQMPSSSPRAPSVCSVPGTMAGTVAGTARYGLPPASAAVAGRQVAAMDAVRARAAHAAQLKADAAKK